MLGIGRQGPPGKAISRAIDIVFSKRMMLTLGFHARPVVWYSMTYLHIASSNAYHARTHSTCLGSLGKGKHELQKYMGRATYLSLKSLMILLP